MGRELATTEVVPGVEVAPGLAGMSQDDYNAAVEEELGLKQEGQE
jgi:hypothetical protein